MGTGLGKNSPIVLTLGKENYEALISRHGQWVRWRVATKCPCVKPNSMQPDIHCEKCGGLGVTYGYQENATVTQTVLVKDSSGIIELDSDYENCPLAKCYDNAGNVYENATKSGVYVMLNSESLPAKGDYITAVMTENVLKTVENVNCSALSNNWYRVDGLRVSKTSIDGLYHTVPSDIENIESVTDSEGNEFTVSDIRQDCFCVENITNEVENEETGETETVEIAPEGDLTAAKVEYIEPFVFVILNQDLSKSDAQVMQDLNGDAVLTFPYAYDVSNDDVITVLSGTYTQKSVVSKKDADYDVIPAYFVDEIISCVGKEREYIAGTDFVLVGTNYLKWLCDDLPEDGDGYSLTYKVFPTYKVVKSIPQIRTSENQRMPKKAIIKLYDTYGETRGVNKNA